MHYIDLMKKFYLTLQEFFAETTYQKSVLESKAKVFQKVLNTKPKLPNVDFSVLENGMESLQTRFQVTPSAC